MESLPINVTDIVIAGILVLSGALAFFRGAVRELFSVLGWLAAAGATFYGFGFLQPYAREIIDIPLLADIAAGAAIFIVTFIAISIVSSTIARRINESRLGPVDRSLGFVFGVARGAAIVCIAYLMITWALPPEDQPDWLREARSMPIVEYGARLIARAVPPEARAAWPDGAEDATKTREAARQAFDPQSAFETLISPPPARDEPVATGYTQAERQGLDRLIQGTQ